MNFYSQNTSTLLWCFSYWFLPCCIVCRRDHTRELWQHLRAFQCI